MTKEVKEALEHVREFYPEVEIVAFNKQGLWSYMDENFEHPRFDDDNINIGILEAAADSLTDLPAIFQL